MSASASWCSTLAITAAKQLGQFLHRPRRQGGDVEFIRVTLEDSIHSHRLRVLREAERSGNVSETCRQYGMSRTEFAGCGGAWNSTAPTACIPSGTRLPSLRVRSADGYR